MAFDLNRSYFNDLRERAVAPAASITEEGQLLMYVDAGDGTLAVQPTAGAGTDRVAGFAITDALKYVTQTAVEVLTVPVGGGTVSLRQNNLVASSTRAVASVTGVLTAVGGAPAAGEFQMAIVAGTITFNVAQAGETVTVTYRYTPTLDEALATWHERSVNNRAQDYFSSVSVGGLEGEIFTTMYDTTLAYTVGALVYTGAAGLVTSAAASTVIVGIVSQVPSVADGKLGVKFSGMR
jgi:hypothetical protein